MLNSFFKKFFWLIPLFLCACATVKNPPQTASDVDLKKYMGKWYEIASFPSFFQKGCHCTVAQYALVKSQVKVYNTCKRGKEDKWDSASAIGWAVPNSHNSKLKIQFFWPFRANYWILYISPDYQDALVGTPNRKYLWVLARKPVMSSQFYKKITNLAEQQGYDTSRLIMTRQDCW